MKQEKVVKVVVWSLIAIMMLTSFAMIIQAIA